MPSLLENGTHIIKGPSRKLFAVLIYWDNNSKVLFVNIHIMTRNL